MNCVTTAAIFIALRFIDIYIDSDMTLVGAAFFTHLRHTIVYLG